MVNQSQFIEMFGTPDNHPAEYVVKNLGDLSECYAGATPSTKVKEYWDNGTIPWMSSGEVHMGHVTETESKITESGYKHASTKMVPVHSVVIALAGQGKTRGTVAITEIPLCTNQSLCAIVPSKDIHYEYLYHNLKGRYLELRGMAGDVNGRGGLNLKIVQSIKIVVPPIAEQMKFVAIAQHADKSKFAGFKSQFIEILNSAEKKVAIGDVISKASKGKTPQYVEHSNVRVMNQACVHWDGMHWENVKYQDPGKLSNKEALNSFDILLNSTGTGTLGRCNIFYKPDDDYTYIPDGHLTVLNTNQDVMRPWLLVYFIKLEDVQREIYDDCVTGSTNQVDLVRKNFLKIRIPLPDMASQIRFDEIVTQADKSKYLN